MTDKKLFFSLGVGWGLTEKYLACYEMFHGAKEHVISCKGTYTSSWKYVMSPFGEYSYRLRRELRSEDKAAPDYIKWNFNWIYHQ